MPFFSFWAGIVEDVEIVFDCESKRNEVNDVFNAGGWLAGWLLAGTTGFLESKR